MIEVMIDDGDRGNVRVAELERGVEAACLALGVSEAEVSVALLDDDAIASLNRTHLGKDRPTDVIAFSLYEEGESVVGDVYIGVEQAELQAAEAGVPLDEELLRLVVHGTLHVLGMDHPDEAEAREESPMYVRQEALVRQVLVERTHS